ncbi:MAG: class I SAM-dependent methyltransferase [Candidatus Pacebacteria bacterium]|nr:class I SAM-dependent methyltransferase [Candidatus Paceibacterota bacterium]
MEGFLNPVEVLKNLELEKYMVAADFGSGSGGWVIPLAKKLEDGRVFAIDILLQPLSVLESRAKMEKLFNIQTIKTDIEAGSKLRQESCDLVLLTNLLFEAKDKKGILKEAGRVLKPTGKILIADWKKDASFGPKEGRVSSDEIEKMAKDLDFKVEKRFDAGLYHWGLILVK